MHQITYFCREKNYLGTSTIGGGKVKKKSFRCQFCDMLLMPVIPKMILLAHGKTEASVNHDLKQIKEL